MGFFDEHRVARRRERQQNMFGYTRGIIKSITGMGDYEIRSNSLMGDGGSGDVPQFTNAGSMRSVRIQHREYLQDVSSSTGFQNLTFAINPANAILFPWLSAMAQNFQEYKIHGMVFTFNSLSSDALNSTNTALGAVIMSTDYNSANQPYASKQAAENSEYTVSCKPSSSLQHGIECDPSMTVNQGHLYISPFNNGTTPAGQDIKTYNLALFQFMTQGSQASATIGELWVSYDIELIKPIDNSQLNRSAADKYQLIGVSPGGGSSGYLFGSGGTGPQGQNAVQTQAGVGTRLDTNTGGIASSIIFPINAIPGQVFLIIYAVNGSVTSGAVVQPTVIANNMTAVNLFDTDSTPNFGSGYGQDTNTVLMLTYVVSSSATLTAPPSISLTASYNIPYGGTADLMIIQLPGNFVN